MNPKKVTSKKQLKKFIDLEREAEIDTILSKIKHETKAGNN